MAKNKLQDLQEKVKAIEIPEIVKPIDKDEILYARSIIRQMHPLRDLSYSEALPFLSFVFGKIKQKGNVDEEKVDLAQNDQLKEDAPNYIYSVSPSLKRASVKMTKVF